MTQNVQGARSPAWNAQTVQDGKTGYMELLFPWQTPGTGLFRIDEDGNVTAATVPGLMLQASTPQAGFALQNATPSILTYTAPSDGNNHRYLLFLQSFVTATATGGQVNVTGTDPGGNSVNLTALANNGSAGAHTPSITTIMVEAGSTITVKQQTALTAGGPVTVWAEVWGE